MIISLSSLMETSRQPARSLPAAYLAGECLPERPRQRYSGEDARGINGGIPARG
jgi:hypothetical protein